jgi:hypothetical protein
MHTRRFVSVFVLLPLLLMIACRESPASEKPNDALASPGAAGHATVAGGHAEALHFEWERGDGTVALLHDGKPVWRLHYGSDSAKPFFHPLALVGGQAVTWQSPPDHPWHRGLWFSWKYLQKVNYWEEDRQTGKSPGQTLVRTRTVETRDDHSAEIELEIVYAPPGEEAVLKERRVLAISAPNGEGGYSINWKATFTAGTNDVVFDRTPLPGEKGGQLFGGYAGLSLRTARDFRNVAVAATSDPGKEVNNRRRFQASAVDFSGTLGGREVGVAFFDDPHNINAPSPWYVITNPKVPFGYVNAAVILYGPYTLPAGKSMTLRYRVVIHAGRWDKTRLTREESEDDPRNATRPHRRPDRPRRETR